MAVRRGGAPRSGTPEPVRASGRSIPRRRPRFAGAGLLRRRKALGVRSGSSTPIDRIRQTTAMRQRDTAVTLGVRDLSRSRRFYEALGWKSGANPEDDVVFFQAGNMVLALWDRAKLARDSCVEDGSGWGGVTLALNLGSPSEVDAATEQARAAGAT